MNYANFGQRLLAFIIDQVIIFIALILFALFLKQASASFDQDSLMGLFFILGWLYFAVQESSKYQATFGKRIISIKVTGIEGGGISFGKATGRYFGKILSSMIFGIGYFMALWTEKRQALHDQLAKTLVISTT